MVMLNLQYDHKLQLNFHNLKQGKPNNKQIQQYSNLNTSERVMQKYPTSDQIYDLSTQDLRKLEERITKDIANSSNGQENRYADAVNDLRQLLETIALEIQERKALEYFSELCKADNPYARKVAAFNQQFLKLAAQTIQKNHQDRLNGVGQYDVVEIPNINSNSSQKSSTSQNKPKTSDSQKAHNSNSIVSQYSSTKSQPYPSPDHQQQEQSDAVSTTTTNTNNNSAKNSTQPRNHTQNTDNSSRVTEVKMNIGAKKGGKGKMKEFMQSILTRTLVQDNGVIKRNNGSPQTGLNPHKKYHIPGQKHQTNQVTSKKSVQAVQTSQKSIPGTKQQSVDKGSSSSTATKKDPKKSKQIKQLVNKMKQDHKKGGGVKLPKINQYKDLVNMVKQQQEKKRNKANINVEKLPQIQSHVAVTTQHGDTKFKVQQQIQQTRTTSSKLVEQKQQAEQKIQVKKQQKDQQIYQQGNSLDQQSGNRPLNQEYIKQKPKLKQKQKPKQKQKQKQKQKGQINSKTQIREAQKNKQNPNSRKNSASQKFLQSTPIQDVIQQQQQMQDSMSPTKTSELLIQKQSQSQKQKQNKHKTRPNSSSIPSSLSSMMPDNANKTSTNLHAVGLKPQSGAKSEIGGSQVSLQSFKVAIDQKVNGEGLVKNENKGNVIHANDQDYTKKLIQQIQKQQQAHQELLKKARQQQEKQSQIQNQEYFTPKNQNNSDHSSSSNNIATTDNKKCYSQQYWAHVREEAQLKIKRFRQEKEYEMEKEKLREKEKEKEKEIDPYLIEDVQNNEEKQPDNQNSAISPKSLQKLTEQQLQFQKQLQAKNQQLASLKKQITMKKTKKVAQSTAVPKTLRPKPQFDYFSIYPTFNHIFSVMYLKPLNQALNDIPNLMRDIKTMFQTHIDHFGNRSNFKPAIFLPFDNNGAFQLTDPKQLIAHAQQTYIDLKVMIERVEIFNQNLHGQFNSFNDDMFYRVVKTKEQVYDIITTSFMRRKGWKQLPHGCSLRASWNLFWSWSKPDIDLNKLLVWQKINHFPFNKNLSRKDLLYRNLDHFRKTFKVPMNFLPTTYNLPKQFSQLSAKFHQQEMINRGNNYWIMKPIGKSRGRGIKVVSSLSELNYTDNIVVQKYILDPMLIDGYKFDMRIYVLVTSFHPLEAFVYRQGFARLSTEKYTLDANSIKNTFVHLTNFAINKNNVSSNSQFQGGSKISMKTLKDKITRMGHSFSNIWSQVHDIIVKSLLGCSVSVPSFPTAFQLFGYDIMVDQQCHCHLIQINASPSLQRSYMIDQIVKQNLIDDIIDIVDPPDFDKKQLMQVFNERIQSITNKKKITPEQDLIGLARILRYKPIRKVGERPAKMGLFEVVAPCELSRELQGVIKARSGANNPMNID